MTERSTHVVLGAGPVGTAVATELINRGFRPTVVTRSGSSAPDATSVALDLHDTDRCAAALSGATNVFHCAQPEYHRWAQEFPALQAAVVELCERLGARLIAIENLYGYGRVDGAMTESSPINPCSEKGAVRAAMSADLVQAHQSGRIRMLAVRASDFFGPGVEGSAYGSRFFDAILAGKRAEVMGDPDALHTVTFVPDIGRTMVELSQHDDAYGRAWHVPSAPAITQRDLADLAADVAGTTARLRPLSPWMLRAIGWFMKPVAESIEMLYEFERDFVMESNDVRSQYSLDHTPLRAALAETMGLTTDVPASPSTDR